MSRSVPKSARPSADQPFPAARRGVLEAMALAVIGRKPLLVLIGDNSSGRSQLFTRVVDYVAADGALALPVVATAGVDIEDLLQTAGNAALPAESARDFDQLIGLLEDQLDQAGIGLLAVENASILAPPVLKDLVAMSRSETPGGRCMQLLLSGTPELERSLARAGLGPGTLDPGAIYRLESGEATVTPEATVGPRAVPADRFTQPPAHDPRSEAGGGPAPTPDPARAFSHTAEDAIRRTEHHGLHPRKRRNRLLAATAVLGLLAVAGVTGGMAYSGITVPDAADSLNRGWNATLAVIDQQLLAPLRGDGRIDDLIRDPSMLPDATPATSGTTTAASPPGTGAAAPAPVPAPVQTAARPPQPAPPSAAPGASIPATNTPTARLDPDDPSLTVPSGPPQEVTEPTSGSETGSATLPPLMESGATQAPPTGSDQALSARVEQLVTQARRQLTQRRLTLPAGDNAYETLTRVREIAPATPAVAEMMTAMEQTYRRWAGQAEQEGDWSRARHFYERALIISPDNADLRQRASAAMQGRSLPDSPRPQPASQPDSNRDQALALLRQPDELRRQLDTGVNPDTRLDGGKTLLILAAEQGMTDTVRLLLSRNARTEEHTADGATAVMYAAWAGHTGVLQALADAGANMDATNDDGKTALMAASARGNLDAVRTLIDRGVLIDRVASHGWSALMYAANNGHDRVARLLVEQGANPYRMDSAGNSALTLGALQGHTDVVETLKPR